MNIMNRNSIKLTGSRFKSLLIMLYFIILAVHNVSDNMIIDYFWYGIVSLSFFLGVIKISGRVNKFQITFLLLYTLTSLINILFIGNSSIGNMIFTLLYWVIFILILDEEVSPQYIGYSIYIDCVLFSCLLIYAGLGTNILDGLSNNYISVILLFPLLIYYIKLEERGRKITLLPAIFVWFTCLLAVGRGGILASSVILLGILGYLFFCKQRWNKRETMYFYRFFISLSFILIIQLAIIFYDVILEWSIFQRFAKHGFYGTGRAGIWNEYLYYTMKNLKNFLFGVDFDSLFQMIRYKDNLHNSFLNVHAYNGIIMLTYIIVCLVRQIILAIRNKRWILVICIMVFCLRAFTDKIFWGGVVGTPLLFFLMWNPNRKLKCPNNQKERLY